MLNCDYTTSTKYKFYNSCCEQEDHINLVGIYDESKIEKALSNFTDADKWTEFFIPEIVDIPDQKPDVESVTSVHSSVEIISQRVIKTPMVISKKSSTVNDFCTSTNCNQSAVCGCSSSNNGDTIGNGECTNLTGRKLIIEGMLKQKIVYTAAVEEQSMHSAHFCIPFSVFIIIESDTPLSQKFRITPYIEDIFTCRLSERSIFKNTTIFIKASKIC